MSRAEARRTPSHTVDRPALRARLDAGLNAPLILLVAPAGAGKSVLLSQWLVSRPDLRIAWIDVTTADADALAFAGRLVAAVADVAPGFAGPEAPVQISEGRLGEAFLEEFAAVLGELRGIVLVLDDVHHLAGTEILADLWRLVDLAPAGVNLVLSSRADLQLGWSRYRLQHGLVEIRQRELAFDVEVTARVLERISGSAVDPDVAATVVSRTEGWAAGVQLTGLTLRFATDPDRFIDSIAETDRLVADYLSEEVLDAQSPEQRSTLKSLAVLDVVSAELADAVTGRSDGDSLLAELEQQSMFIVRVPGRPGWFRFHRLFRDLLLYRLRAMDVDGEARVLSRAAEWHLAHGETETAIEYLLRAASWDEALEVLLTVDQSVYEQVRMPTVTRWLSRVPREVRARRPRANLLLGIANGMSGNAVVAADILREVLSSPNAEAGDRQVALAYTALLVHFLPHPEQYVEYARRSLAELEAHPDAVPPDIMHLTSRDYLRTVSRASLGRALFLLGELAESRRVLHAVLRSEAAGYIPYRIHVLGSLALVEAFAGRLSVATELSDEALTIMREVGMSGHPAPAEAHLARAIIAIQRGDTEIGALALNEGYLRASMNQRRQLMWIAYLASVLLDPLGTDPASIEPEGPPPPIVRDSLRAIRMRGARAGDKPAPTDAPISRWSPAAFEEIAARLAENSPADARTQLAQIPFQADELEPRATVERELLLGWLCALEHRSADSRRHLAEALRIAEPERLVHPFARAGRAVADLVDDLPGVPSEFRWLVVRRGRAAGPTRTQPLAEPLTSREIEILAYLPSRMTIAEIAARCFVSTNTIKTHMGHIYRKLDVTGRDAAIGRALEFGLLEPTEIVHAG